MFLRRLFTFIGFCLISLTGKAGDSLYTPGSWSLGFKAQSGFIMAHRPAVEYLQKGKVSSYEITVLKSSDGSAEWKRIYNEPLYGIAYQYFNLGNSEVLGNAHGLYALLLLPLLHEHHLRANIRIGVGVAYVEKAYSISENYKNQAIGSRLNGLMTTGIQFRIPCKTKMQLSFGFDFTHFSNGATHTPNLGLNIPSLNIGVQHFFGKALTLVRDTTTTFKRSNEISFYAAGGIKEQYPPDGKKYGIAVISATLHRLVSPKGQIGFGADVFYDPTIQGRILRLDSIRLGPTEANLRAGIHVSAGLRINRVSGLFQTGIYLYNRLPRESFLYSRLSLRYFVCNNIFLCFNLKTHYGKADYFETGIGYRISR